MAGFARKFPFSERRATMRTWSRGVGLLLLVASGVPNAVFVEEIVGSAAAIRVLPPCGQIYLGRSTGCSTIHEPHGYIRHSSEARPPFSPSAEPSGTSLRGTAESGCPHVVRAATLLCGAARLPAGKCNAAGCRGMKPGL